MQRLPFTLARVHLWVTSDVMLVNEIVIVTFSFASTDGRRSVFLSAANKDCCFVLSSGKILGGLVGSGSQWLIALSKFCLAVDAFEISSCICAASSDCPLNLFCIAEILDASCFPDRLRRLFPASLAPCRTIGWAPSTCHSSFSTTFPSTFSTTTTGLATMQVWNHTTTSMAPGLARPYIQGRPSGKSLTSSPHRPHQPNIMTPLSPARSLTTIAIPSG